MECYDHKSLNITAGVAAATVGSAAETAAAVMKEQSNSIRDDRSNSNSNSNILFAHRSNHNTRKVTHLKARNRLDTREDTVLSG